MPVITIEYDKTKLTRKQIRKLSEALQKIVSEETGIEDVFVYANSSQITYNYKTAPIEVFIQLTASKIANNDVDALVEKIRKRITKWKKEAGFKTLINLSFIPMNWKIAIGI